MRPDPTGFYVTQAEEEAIRAAITFLTTDRTIEQVYMMFPIADKTSIHVAIRAIQTYDATQGN
jgi:hypothetical protein